MSETAFLCPDCGKPMRMQVQATISAPAELMHKFSKSNIARKDVQLLGVNWETADRICYHQTERRCSMTLTVYYWAAFTLSLVCLLYIPSKRVSGIDNFGGSVVLSLFGFLLWPLFVIAAVKVKMKGGAA